MSEPLFNHWIVKTSLSHFFISHLIVCVNKNHCVHVSVCIQNIALYLKQGHVLAIILLSLLCGSITAIDERAAFLGVTVSCKKQTHKHLLLRDWSEIKRKEHIRREENAQLDKWFLMSKKPFQK